MKSQSEVLRLGKIILKVLFFPPCKNKCTRIAENNFKKKVVKLDLLYQKKIIMKKTISDFVTGLGKRNRIGTPKNRPQYV